MLSRALTKKISDSAQDWSPLAQAGFGSTCSTWSRSQFAFISELHVRAFGLAANSNCRLFAKIDKLASQSESKFGLARVVNKHSFGGAVASGIGDHCLRVDSMPTQSPTANATTDSLQTHHLQSVSNDSAATSLLIGSADLLLDEHHLGLSANSNGLTEIRPPENEAPSSWSFNNLFHQMGHQTFAGDQMESNYEEHNDLGVIQHSCSSSSNIYPAHYFNYTLNGEFGDANYTNTTTTNFFPPNIQLSYSLNYGSNPALTDATALQVLATDELNVDAADDSNYSGNLSGGSSRSQSTTSSQNPTFYSEIKPTNFNTATANVLHQRSPFEPFCTVPGRTSLLSSTTKYKVTVGEIQRRISPPECLNASLLGGILRKAKSKDGGKALRESLRRIGLTLPAGRRKSAHVTALTALVEEEAIHIAKDFHSVCERDFPSKEIAHFLSRHVNNDEEAHQRRTMLHYVRMYIKELSDLMNADRSPVCASRPDIILDPSIQKPLTHFSMVTHGFGGLIFLSVLDALNNSVHESIKHLDRTYNTNRHNGYGFPS